MYNLLCAIVPSPLPYIPFSWIDTPFMRSHVQHDNAKGYTIVEPTALSSSLLYIRMQEAFHLNAAKASKTRSRRCQNEEKINLYVVKQ